MHCSFTDFAFHSNYPSFFILSSIRLACKKWFGYTIPVFQPLYTFIPLVSPLKKNDNMDGFNLGEDNQIKSITIKDGKLRFEVRKRCLLIFEKIEP